MGKIIAVNGKGGTGKTTVSALLVRGLVERKAGSVLAVDADPNSCLQDLLGVKDPSSVVGIIEGIAKNMGSIPAGMTKDRFIEMKVQEALTEEKGYDLLVMGRPEGPGCYCYVNNLLRDLIGKITKNYDFVVIDNAAGMEHISRRTARAIDKLVLVSDYSAIGVRSAKRIHELAGKLDIKIGETLLLLNKVLESSEPLDDEIKKACLRLSGTLPHSEMIRDASLSNRSVFELKDAVIKSSIDRVIDEILKTGEKEICRSK